MAAQKAVTQNITHLPYEESCRYKNIAVVQIAAPFVLRKILSKASKDKLAEQTYLQFFDKTKGLTKSKLKDVYKTTVEDRKKLETCKDSAGFDVPLLIKATFASDSQLNVDSTCGIELTMKQVREHRNDISHDVSGKSIDPNVFSVVEKLLEDLLKESKILYNESDAQLKLELEELSEIIKRIGISTYENDLEVNKTYFIQTGKTDNLNYWKQYRSDTVVPFDERRIVTDVFYPMNVRTTPYPEYVSYKSYTELIGIWSSSDEKITILAGEAGSGKSTVVRNIAYQFFGLSTLTMTSLEEFDMIHFLECRDSSITSFEDYLLTCFPTAYRKMGPANVMQCFLSIKNLFIVDGFDEINRTSAIVFNSLLNKLKCSSTHYHCIITTRSHALPELQSLLFRERLWHRTCILEEIYLKEKQIQFLIKYENSNIPAVGLTDTFHGFCYDVTSYFVSPISLVWYFFLCLLHENSVKKWLQFIDITNHIWIYYKEILDRYLKTLIILNRSSFLNRVMHTLAKYSFKCLGKNKISLTQADFESLAKQCMPILEKYNLQASVKIKRLLTNLFVTKKLRNNELRYEFFHKSHQELFGAKILLYTLRKKDGEQFSVLSTIQRAAGTTDKQLIGK